MAASSVFDLDSSRLLTRDAAGTAAEKQVHQPPVQVHDQPHRPWGDEEEHDPGHEDTDVSSEPGRRPRVVAGVDQPAKGAEPRWRAATEQR